MSASSCLIRNDYNILFAFLILMILNRLYQENDKFYMKVLIHLLLALIIVDILWLIVVMPYWTNHTGKNSYWDSLSGIHTFTIVMAFLELFLKAAMIGLIFIEFRKHYATYVTDLLQFSYSAQSFPITLSKYII
jgi:hypothetical protein